MTNRTLRAAVITLLLGAALPAVAQPGADGPPINWRETERGVLAHHVQLTSVAQFIKAGESYFSPDDSMIVFQAVETPPPGEAAAEFYGMYVGDVVRDDDGRVSALDNIRRISPEGSANTCGWFHPTDPNIVIFGTTVGPPTESAPPGYQRSTGRYRWMFPPEMRIVQVHLDAADGTEASLETLVKADAYLAECSLSRDGRHLLYCSLERGGGDILVRDLTTGISRTIVPNEGYDGGPFFSPDGKRICYRSDRRGNHLLQLFVADLRFDETGAIVGIEREYQLTDNENVNWCPFWLPSGRHLVYGTSEVGHSNYEVFLIDADPGNLPGSSGSIKYGAGLRRVTNASGADVLPALSSDGRTMVWTSQRGDSHTSQLWVADFVLDPDAAPDLSAYDPSSHRTSDGSSKGTAPGTSPHTSGSGGGDHR